MGLGIDGTAAAHIIGDVSDGDIEVELIALLFAVHGIVKVLGILTVDGDQRQLTQIHASAALGG